MTNDEYIGYVELGKALCHEGVPGMAWGVQNGPPYPLNYEGKARLNSNKKVLGSSSNARHYGVNAKVGKFVQKASTDRATLNRKLAENKLKGQEDKVKLSNARHVTKSTKQSNKTNEQMKKLEDKQAIEKQKAALKDARHKGSLEFRLRQDALLRAQYKNEMARLKAERQKIKENANKDKIARAEAKERMNSQAKAEREKAKAQLKLEKEKAKQEEKARNQEAKLADKAMKIAAKQEAQAQKAQAKADNRANEALKNTGSKQLLNRNMIINSGDPKMLKKYGKYLNNEEYKLATNRIQQVNELKSAKLQSFIDRGKKLADGAQNIANFTTQAVNTYNNVAKAMNAFGGKNWKIIGAEPKKAESAKDKADRLKNEIIAKALSTDEGKTKYTDAIMRQFTNAQNDSNKGGNQNNQNNQNGNNQQPSGKSGNSNKGGNQQTVDKILEAATGQGRSQNRPNTSKVTADDILKALGNATKGKSYKVSNNKWKVKR